VACVAESRERMKKVSAPMTRRSPTPTLAGRLAPPPNVTVVVPALMEAEPVE